MTGDEALLKEIRLVVFDFDGVFTDNRVLVGDDGHEYVLCSRGDGLGIESLAREGVAAIILSTETNPVVRVRAEKLKLECIHGCADKGKALQQLVAARGYSFRDVAFVGNDVNDRECLLQAGVAICVADAHPDVKSLAHLVTTQRGGRGAVREICDALVRARRRA